VNEGNDAVQDAPIRILIVDDEQVVCDAVARQLRAAGFSVLVAYSGMAALEIIREQPLDLALLDIRMPRITGFDVLRELTTQAPRVKAIMMTAFADIKSAVNCISLGASDIISKPVDIDEVVLSIRRCLAK
jgi:DNA-binding NtrC family response regulator